MCLRIGERHCSFAITDRQGKDLYSLGYYTAVEMNAECLGSIFLNHAELGKNFYAVQVGFDHAQSVLVPVQFFHAEDAENVFNTMHGKQEGLVILSESVKEWQLHNVYAVKKELFEWLKRRFPSASFYHNYSVRIKLPAGDADRILVDMQTDEFSVIAVKANKLIVAQTYSYSSPADILYYLLKICEQFGLSQRETELCIAGLIERESALFRELNQYFMNASFREPIWEIPGMDERQYPSHFFTPLNDLARCVS